MQDAPDEILHLALLTFGDPAAATLAVRLQGRGTAGAVQLSSAQWSCASCWRKHGRKRRDGRRSFGRPSLSIDEFAVDLPRDEWWYL